MLMLVSTSFRSSISRRTSFSVCSTSFSTSFMSSWNSDRLMFVSTTQYFGVSPPPYF